jgi:transcriptional regulator with XRE-family HTH domain
MKITEVLAWNLKKFRESRGLTLEQMGRALGVSRQAIWNLENETSWITVDKIEKFSVFFNIEQHELFQIEPSKNKSKKQLK